jgi:hypothetical protein
MSDQSDAERVFQELLDTEITYNTNLQLVRRHVIIPLLDAVQNQRLRFDGPQIPRLFEVLDQILMTSTRLKKHLDRHYNESKTPILRCLEPFPKSVETYFHYIQAYGAVLSQLITARNTNREIGNFFAAAENELGRQIDFYLIEPVQRTPRYRLLFRDLVRKTPPDSPDYPGLAEAAETMEAEVLKLEGAIALVHEATAMGELEGRFDFTFRVFEPNRRLFYQGEVSKFSRKTIQPRYLVLFSDCLVVAEPGVTSHLSVNTTSMSGEYRLTSVEDGAPFVNAVDVLQAKKSFRVNMANPGEKTRIFEAYQKMLLLNQLDDAALEQKGFAPLWIPNELAPLCMQCGQKFVFPSRMRHHCRNCGACICTECSHNKIAIPGKGPKPERVCPPCFDRISGASGRSSDA